MRLPILAAAVLALVLALATAPATMAMAAGSQATDIDGVWRTKTGGYVQIYRKGDSFIGKIVGSVSGKPRYDSNNPDKSKRSRRLLGVNILHGLRYKGDREYDDGQIYDPNNGKTYKAKATLKDPDTLDARGFIGFSLFGKTQTWHRIDPKSENVHQDLLRKPIGASPQSGG